MRRLADRLSHRSLTTTAVVSFALAGAAIAYAVPLAASHGDGWFAVHNGDMTTGLLAGLFTSYVGVHIAQLLTPRKDRDRAHQTKTRHPARHAEPAAAAEQTQLGSQERRQQPPATALPQPVPMPGNHEPHRQRLACPRKC